ncbi:MAG: MoaD/ThiS family protein [Agriterribacter sp.]
MTVMLFGQLKEVTGNSFLQVENVRDTNELQAKLQSLFPRMAEMKYAIAVNKKIVSTNTVITHESTVALLPPFSGG